jgi:hypothetical protein
MKKYRVKVYDTNYRYLKTLEFANYDLCLSEMVNGQWHIAELIDKKEEEEIKYTFINNELKIGV